MPLKAGERLLHYRLLEKIGAGGMGVVWKGLDTGLDREVAIKVLPEGLGTDAQRLERFEREAKLLASLNHARIAAVYGFHEANGVRFLAMELVDGEDLAERLSRGPVSRYKALQLALQLAEGLEAAHGSGVIHRDLKPGNIRLTPGGDVKILDFGLAKALLGPLPDGEVELTRSPTMTAATQAGVILGTAAYMSPEQARGKEADRRTDVWAFGCLLYEMLTGEGVFHAETASDCIARILERQPDWDALPPDTPRVVRRLLRRCLEKDARRRLHDIADARIEIEDALAGGTADGGSEALESRPAAGSGGGTRIVWAAAGLVLGIALTWLAVTGPRQTEASVPGSARRLTVTLPPASPVVPSAGTVSVALSPDGSRLVYVGVVPQTDAARKAGGADFDAAQLTQLFSRRLDEYEVRPIDGTRGAVSPFFSPDGEWVGFIDRKDGELKKIRLRGGVPVALGGLAADLIDAGAGVARAGHWAEDGRIYFTGVENGILAVSEDGGEPVVLTSPEENHGEKTRRFPHVLPGGRGLLFTLGTAKMSSYDEASIGLLDLETQEHRLLLQGGTDPAYVSTGHIVYGRAGSLEAVPFDLDSLQVTGAPFTVAADVITSDGWGEAQYAISASGNLAYVPGGPEIYRFGVYWLDREGNVEEIPLPTGSYSAASFSPDGDRLALNMLGANASIWVYSIERRTMTRLTSEWDNVAPTWMLNGSHLTFNAGRAGQLGLWRVAADGSGPPEPIHDLDQFGAGTSWIEGDARLLMTSGSAETGADVVLLTPGEPARVEPLVRTPFHDAEPRLSPDGKWLTYTSDATGRTELYLQRFPVGDRRWQVSVGGGERPRWAPDGRELYYWKGSRLMAVSLGTGPDLVLGRERELPQPAFDALLDWDIAPDGSRFVVVGRVATESTRTASSGRNLVTAPRIRVVLDWFEELRRHSE